VHIGVLSLRLVLQSFRRLRNPGKKTRSHRELFLVLILSIGTYESECREATIQEVRLLRSGDDRSVSKRPH
jgi:hypothetical protein